MNMMIDRTQLDSKPLTEVVESYKRGKWKLRNGEKIDKTMLYQLMAYIHIRMNKMNDCRCYDVNL